MFSISESAKYLRTTRDTLLHYDRIGLLSPMTRGDNRYRYYSNGQLSVANLIRTMQALGMTLSEIKDLKDCRTPQKVEEVLTEQIAQVDEKIKSWNNARKLLLTLIQIMQSVKNVNEQAVTVQFYPTEAIMLGGLNDYSQGKDDYRALFNFYRDMERKYPDLDMNYPVWGLFSQERIRQGDWVWPDRFYFYNPDGYDRRPAGLYAVGYMRGGYGQSTALYRRIIEHINMNGLEICGDTYEEYPLNELSVSDDNDYLMRVMIAVREKPMRKRSEEPF
jgi:DNA-binding transcriptional MerR regulator